MITSFNLSISNNRSQKQNQKFGNLWTASKTRDDIWKGLLDTSITSTDAYKRTAEAIEKEDKIGKKILEGFTKQLDAWYKKPNQ